LAAIVAALTLFALWTLITSCIFISHNELEFRYGLKTRMVDLRVVKNIYVQGLFIIIDEGRIPRLTIPRIFSRERLLIDNMERGRRG
jgi:hypothetical protein